MKYTVRYAHMENAPKWKAGDVLKSGDIIGKMGTTGQSTGKHLHIDCIEGVHNMTYKLSDIMAIYTAREDQLVFFASDDLFGIEPVVVTAFLDPEYKNQFGKDHPGYDIVPKDRKETEEHFNIHWNRSVIGNVELVVFQPESYGNCIYVSFEI